MENSSPAAGAFKFFENGRAIAAGAEPYAGGKATEAAKITGVTGTVKDIAIMGM